MKGESKRGVYFMGGINLQTMVETFRQFVQKKGWSIVAEKELG
jgi:hypothetical protein